MSSYSEIKADIRGVFLFFLLAALAVLGLSLFGALGLIIGMPEAFVVPGEVAEGGLFDVSDQLRRGGFFSGVSLLAGYGFLNIQLFLILDATVSGDSQQDPLANLSVLLGLNLCLGLVSFIVVAYADTLFFHVVGLILGYGMRYLVNPVFCALWLGFGVNKLQQGRRFSALIVFFGIPFIWLAARIVTEVGEFLFQPIS